MTLDCTLQSDFTELVINPPRHLYNHLLYKCKENQTIGSLRPKCILLSASLTKSVPTTEHCNNIPFEIGNDNPSIYTAQCFPAYNFTGRSRLLLITSFPCWNETAACGQAAFKAWLTGTFAMLAIM